MAVNEQELIQPTEPASMELHHAVEQHYYREARRLSNRQYREWLNEMVAPDIHYWMPVLQERFVNDRQQVAPVHAAAVYNDDFEMLRMRVERLYTGLVWMEDPPSRIRYLITNVEVYHTARPEELYVYSNFHIIRHRRAVERYEHTGAREDVLRRDGDGFRLARRKILLDARVVDDKNLYFFA